MEFNPRTWLKGYALEPKHQQSFIAFSENLNSVNTVTVGGNATSTIKIVLKGHCIVIM